MKLNFKRCDEFKETLGIIPITKDIFFYAGKRTKFWTPRSSFGIVKNGEFKNVNIRKTTYVTLIDGIVHESLEDAVRMGYCIKYTPEELQEVAKEIGYFKPISKDGIRKTVSWFIHGSGEDYEYGMEQGNRIKSILTDEEKACFHEWEEMVGYEDVEVNFLPWKHTRREYNCNEWELESALYVVMNSPRLLNAAIYCKEYGIDEHSLHFIWNYLLCYEKKESFVEVMHFSDWDRNDPDTLHEKYNIPDKIVEREDKSFIRRNDASLYVGEDYKMAIQITASFDDWGGIAVVVPKDCKLSPFEIVSAGESVNYVEDNFFVKNQLVRA